MEILSREKETDFFSNFAIFVVYCFHRRSLVIFSRKQAKLKSKKFVRESDREQKKFPRIGPGMSILGLKLKLGRSAWSPWANPVMKKVPNKHFVVYLFLSRKKIFYCFWLSLFLFLLQISHTERATKREREWQWCRGTRLLILRYFRPFFSF